METIRDKAQWMVRDETITNYLDVCKEAVEDDNVFKIFKIDNRYTAILEHVSREIAENYLRAIERDNKWLLFINKLWTNDDFGSPKKEHFFTQIQPQQDLYCSPSTLQYIGVLSNLINNFKSLDNFSIVEIGGGYGGQCKIINDVFKVKEYHIIDLLEPSLLQRKYLSKFENNAGETFTIEETKEQEYDLVISNYALSEVLEPLQTQYIENVLLKSNHGYITCNRQLNAIDLIKEKFDTFKISKDIKGESDTNYIITW